MPSVSHFVLQIIAEAVVLVPLTGVLFAAWLKLWGEAWITHRFEAQLQEQRQAGERVLRQIEHDNNRELERYRVETNRLLARATRVEDREFEILPALYETLVDTLSPVESLLSPLQIWADVDALDPEHLEEFVQNLAWNQVDKKRLVALSNPERGNFYRERVGRYRLQSAYESAASFSSQLKRGKIFLRENLYNSFDGLDRGLWGIIEGIRIRQEAGFSHEDWHSLRDEYQRVSEDANVLADQLNVLLHEYELPGPGVS